MLGDLSACEQALATADTTLGQVDEMDVAFKLYSVTQFGRIAGSCYLSLEDTRRARGYLEDTAAALGDGSKSQAIALANLAVA